VKKVLFTMLALILALGLALPMAMTTTTPVMASVQTIASPTANSGAWASGENAYSSNGLYASTSTNVAIHTFSQYVFTTGIDATDTIETVEVGVEAYQAGDERVNINVSWDAGTTWSGWSTQYTPPASDTDTVNWWDVTSLTTWTTTEIGKCNLMVQIRYQKQGGTASLVSLDWIPVRVTHSSTALEETTKDPGYDDVSVAGWNNGSNAYSSNNIYATTNTHTAVQTYTTYGFSLGTTAAAINKVEVGVEAYQVAGTDGQPENLDVHVSWDNGVNWYDPAGTAGGWSSSYKPPTSDPNCVYWWDFTGAKAVWTATDLDNDHFKVQVRYQKQGAEASTVYLDWIPVRVIYTPATAASISGAKFYDANTNGVWNEGEPAIEGWMVELYDESESYLDTQLTDVDGEYLFDDLDAGTYTVKEVMPPGETIFNDITYPTWLNTTDDSITIEDLSGASEDNDFGNVCIGYDGGGHTIGFWRNPNGEDKIGEMNEEETLAYLSDLNLVDADGNSFNPTTYAQLDDWLHYASATNMAYMLSAQLAAMELNVSAEFVDGSALVYAPGTNSANAAGFDSISDLMTEADEELGLHVTALAGDSWRAYQEALKNALDAANNNINFVCPEPCLPIEYP
jgi:hypothetical protein